MMKNSSSKSVVLAPFNTVRKTDIVDENSLLEDPIIASLLVARKCIKYGKNCKELNREYEKFNN